MNSIYLTSAQTPQQLPEEDLPEIAVIGRSNCGKSSLINAVLNRKDLARTSSTPGRTQMANFFLINDKQLVVDLPGYGFSATGKSARKYWQSLLDTYITRKVISNKLFLMDIRRSLTEEDYALATFMSKYHPIDLVLTKADKIPQSKRNPILKNHVASLASRGVEIKKAFIVSSLKKTGVEDLRSYLFPSKDE